MGESMMNIREMKPSNLPYGAISSCVLLTSSLKKGEVKHYTKHLCHMIKGFVTNSHEVKKRWCHSCKIRSRTSNEGQLTTH